MIKAVIFDLDDTLIDWSGVTQNWDDIIAGQLAPVLSYLAEASHAVPDSALLVSDLQERIRGAWRATMPPEWKSPQHRVILQDSLRDHGVPVDEIGMELLYERLAWGLVPGVKAFPHTKPILTRLRESGLKIGLLTNAAQPMRLRDIELETLGLLDYFDYRTSAADVGIIKPHPEPFRVVMNALGVAADETFYVGDRPHDDVLGAQAAGMRAVWVRRPFSQGLDDSIKPNAIIDSLGELPGVIDRWYPGWQATG